MKIGVFLDKPFWYLNSAKNKWLYIVVSACFVLVFLLLFMPFGLSEEVNSPINPLRNILFFFISVTLNTFVTLSILQFHVRKILGFEHVTNRKYIIWFFIEILALTIVNFFLSFFVPDLGNDFEEELNITFQIKNYLKTIIILLFPFVATVVYILIQNLNNEIHELGGQLRNYQSKYKNKQKSEFLEIKDENENLDFSVELGNFLYVESSNQYILIYYLKEGKIKKHITRNRMKSFLIQTKNYPIKQCHRSYAVNLLNVDYMIKVRGKDFLINTNIEALKVPISKSYLDIISNEVLLNK